MITTTLVGDALYRNGIEIERARRAHRSIHDQDHNVADIIDAGRRLARSKGLSQQAINAIEMQGERDWERVLAPLKVVAVFAFYWGPEWTEGAAPRASYLVRESNHPAFPECGNLSAEDFEKFGMKVPKTPSYEAWVAAGSKAVNS